MLSDFHKEMGVLVDLWRVVADAHRLASQLERKPLHELAIRRALHGHAARLKAVRLNFATGEDTRCGDTPIDQRARSRISRLLAHQRGEHIRLELILR